MPAGAFAPCAVMVASALVYYLLIRFVFPATRPTTPEGIAKCQAWRDWHNFALFVFSACCCIGAAIWLYDYLLYLRFFRILAFEWSLQVKIPPPPFVYFVT